MIELREVQFEHPAATGAGFALRIPHLVVGAGERVACIGASGSGKTTLLHLISGVLTPERGIVSVLGMDLGACSESQRRTLRLERMGLVFQELELIEYLSAHENIVIGARLGMGALDRALCERVRPLAERAGIAPLLGRKPARLSQGERQRVALCRALLAEPPLILCDEPTGSLDPESTARVLDLIDAQAAATGATVVVVTHDHQALGRFDRVVEVASLNVAAREPAGALT